MNKGATFTIFVQEKYEEAIASLAQMEKRAVMAETMLEATLQYQSGQVKAQPSPRYVVNFAEKISASMQFHLWYLIIDDESITLSIAVVIDR